MDVDDLPGDDELRRVVGRAVGVASAAAVVATLLGVGLWSTGVLAREYSLAAAAVALVLGALISTWPLGHRSNGLCRRETRVAGSWPDVRRYEEAVVDRTAIGLGPEDLRTCTVWARVAVPRLALAVARRALITAHLAGLALLVVLVSRSWPPSLVWVCLTLVHVDGLWRLVRLRRAVRRFLAAIDELESRR